MPYNREYFTHDEADRLGAFREEALDEHDALEAAALEDAAWPDTAEEN